MARSLDLTVHAWTFRDDRIDPRFDSAGEELAAYYQLGIDGFFTDFPDTTIKTLIDLSSSNQPSP